MRKNKENNFIRCKRCVYDTTIPGIRFDKEGICQYCRIHEKLEKIYPLNKKGNKKFKKIISVIKRNGKGKKYDCVVGISGGTDSTYSLYLAVKLGLRPLAVHFDNGWNSEIAVRNIYNATSKLKVDLETVVADWEEFRDLQTAFLKASVSDAEIPTDVAIHSVLHRVAAKEKIKYILLGHSFRAEGIVPFTWTYMDGKYISSVHKKFGIIKKKLSIPNLTLFNLIDYVFLKRIKVIPILNYYEYNKTKAGEILQKELSWKYYGGHHHESLYTKFFQSYFLPRKFNFDKRKLSFSARIRTGDLKREEAIKILESEKYFYDEEIVNYVIDKLNLTQSELNKILKEKPKSFRDYPNYYSLLKFLKLPIYLGYKLNLVSEIIYFKYFA